MSIPKTVEYINLNFANKKARYVARLFAFILNPANGRSNDKMIYFSSIFLYMSEIIFPAVSFPPSPIANPMPNANAATTP